MTGQIGEVLIFFGAVLIIAVAGVLLGMLVAPRLGRLAEREDEEEPGGDD